jgi:DNA-binding Lrp family transcriptional regulator
MESNINQQYPSGEINQLDFIHAYIFVRTQGGDMNRMLENAKKLKQVTSTAVVAGDYDLVMKVQVQTLEQLMKVTDKIQCLHGILQTSTHIIEKEVFP